jgi:hypothetical protein
MLAVMAGSGVAPGAAAGVTEAGVTEAGVTEAVVTASSVGLTGNDVSWPQCSRALGGYGLPMPPDSARVVVVGLTKGLPFTVNPCLATQVAWVTAHRLPPAAYTVPAYPSAAQLTTYGSRGPWAATTAWARLANVGYAEGGYALDRLADAGFAARMIWIDVEARSVQPWPTSTRAAQALNRALLTGLTRRLDEAGDPYGFYSNASGWQTITGSWRLPGTPAWVTVGPRTSTEAIAACASPSFSTGPAHLAQWWDDLRDYDLACAAYTAVPSRPWPASGAHDLDGDWSADPLARDRATGALVLLGSGTDRRQIGNGWQGMDVVLAAGDLTGDGVPDVVARQRESGAVWLYPRTATGRWQDRQPLATSWSTSDQVVAAGDVTGDQVPDLLTRQVGTGALWLHAGTGASGLRGAVRVGSGWQVFDTVLGAGDVDGDGTADVLARRIADGTLWLYPGNGRGGWGKPRQVGRGWSGFDLLTVPGDLTGDGAPDVVARERTTGRSWIYPTDGSGRWRSRIDRGTDWQALDLLA